MDEAAKQALASTSGMPATQRLASDYIADELKECELSNDDWSKAGSEYLQHHGMLQRLPDAHESVVHFRLRCMENALEKMYKNDGGQRFPYGFYAEGIAHVQEEVEEAAYAMSSAGDPHAEDIPAGKPGGVAYATYYQLRRSKAFFSDSAHLLSRHSGEGKESDEWRAARMTYLRCLDVYLSPDTHIAHARFAVHRAQLAFAQMKSEYEKRGEDNIAAHGFYNVGERRLAELKEATEYETASAPTLSEADRRALERNAQSRD